MKFRIVATIGILSLCLNSCQTLKPYQMQFVNDYYMEQGPLSVESAEVEGFSYRSGASGGESGKSGGGCGCN
ncbi:MAG: DUF4266 domain-containing protein [Psychroserpens sp.]|nr:DUF4266 domain-containing protein [Psychroserpens sp.]